MKRHISLNLLATMSVLGLGVFVLPQQAKADEWARGRHSREHGAPIRVEYRRGGDYDDACYERARIRREEERRRCEEREERRRCEEREERRREECRRQEAREERYRESRRSEERHERRHENWRSEERHESYHREHRFGGHETHS